MIGGGCRGVPSGVYGGQANLRSDTKSKQLRWIAQLRLAPGQAGALTAVVKMKIINIRNLFMRWLYGSEQNRI
jgi:hypothetical protein